MAAHCILSEGFLWFYSDAFGLCFIIYFFLAAPVSTKVSKLGRLGNIIVWEVEGELIVLSASVFVFRIGSVSAPWDYDRV